VLWVRFWGQQAIILAVIVAVASWIGGYLAKAFDHKPAALDGWFRPIENGLLRLVGYRNHVPAMTWRQYTAALLWSNLFMALLLYTVLVLQGHLPFNPQHLPGMEPTLAFNTAASFITNTNWQAYTGETTLSNFSQMAAITFPMFTSAATGFGAAIAFIRGLIGRPHLGNFYEDMIRLIVRILLPGAILAGLLLVLAGVPQTLAPTVHITGPQGLAQAIPRGPVASLDSIKHFGTNGGGFYGQNSAHPLENPTPLSCALQALLMSALPAALPFAFGRMLGRPRQGWVIFLGMAAMFLIFQVVIVCAEVAGNPMLTRAGLDQAMSAWQAGGSMEGKEVRFGEALTSLFTTCTTAMTTGTVNCMHDSLTPMGGFVPLSLMMLNCVYGGKGVGFMNYMMYGILAVFLAGLMVGRTPELFGKKIEQPEMLLASLSILFHPLFIIAPTVVAVLLPMALSSLNNLGYHGFTEILYAYTSAVANNGSAFAGLNANTPWYNLSLGVMILLGRYLSIIALLAIAGSLMQKKRLAESPGTLKTDTPLFAVVWVAVIGLVGALTFFPFVALGPIAEQGAMAHGRLF
jgi:K+-transporting ATPase ATPase A chain